MMKELFRTAVRAYQYLVSPVFGRHCRFEPSCSQYLLDAIEEKGLGKGFALGVWRIFRCQPLSKGGWDPVIKKRERGFCRKHNSAEGR